MLMFIIPPPPRGPRPAGEADSQGNDPGDHDMI